MKKTSLVVLTACIMMILSSCQNLLGGLQVSSGEEISSNEISSEEISSEEGYKLPETNNYRTFVDLINKDIEDGKEVPYSSLENKFGEAHFNADIEYGFSQSIWFIGDSNKIEWLINHLDISDYELEDVPSGYVEMVIVIYNGAGIVMGSSYDIFDFEENFGHPTHGPSVVPSVEDEPSLLPSVEVIPSEPSLPESNMSVGLGYSYAYTFYESYYEYFQLDLTAAFVAFDEEGRIIDTRIDVVQIKAEKNENGDIQIKDGTKFNDDGSIKTKLELGKDYNMVTYGLAIAEVDAQIEAFADWTMGKTVEELKANVAKEHGYGLAPNPDLESSVTIVCHDFVESIEMAWENKTEATYQQIGHAGIAMLAGLNTSYGTYEMAVDIGGVMASDGIVYASQIDAIVLQLSEDENGKITAKEGQKYLDADGNLLSKKALGNAYGMRPVSPIMAEWYEQAKAIEDASICKSIDEILALQAGEGDLAGATIKLDNYLYVIAKAAKYSELEHIGPQA